MATDCLDQIWLDVWLIASYQYIEAVYNRVLSLIVVTKYIARTESVLAMYFFLFFYSHVNILKTNVFGIIKFISGYECTKVRHRNKKSKWLFHRK